MTTDLNASGQTGEDHGFRPLRNSFHETLLGLSYAPRPADQPADLFSQACAEQYAQCDPTSFGYLFAQVFEPDVLREIAALEGLPYDDLQDLAMRPTAAIEELADRLDHAAELSPVELVNLAAALISISRFRPAAVALRHAAARATGNREAFEIAMLDFVVTNRVGNGAGTAGAFHRMRVAIESGALPPERVLDACAQAVVWHLKRRELTPEDFEWFTVLGERTTAHAGGLDPGAVSSWFRAAAMLPAAGKDATRTRELMERAREAADEAMKLRPRAYELHFMKTYFESSLKEHMYLTWDPGKAEHYGRKLIDIDPAWSPSYGELADAHAHFGKHDAAAELYDQAAHRGPPYVSYHLIKAAQMYERLGDDDRALARYMTVVRLVPDHAAAHQMGLSLAERTGHSLTTAFEQGLDRIVGA